jgi:hypothetical protein
MTDEPILYRLIEMVRESRQRTAAHLPLPDAGACIDYAITESGEYLKALTQAYIDEAIISATEYLDAYLRAHRKGDKRRQDKEHSMVKEWGQCGYMLASAAIQMDSLSKDEDYSLWCSNNKVTVYDVLRRICLEPLPQQMGNLLDSLDMWACFAMQTLHIDPLALMAETCQYFENKFMPKAEVGA